LNINKKGIRVLAIAESFRKQTSNSILTGVIMRKDLVIDGIVFGKATIGGNDATQNIIGMYNNLERNDIGFILLDGMIISMFNIIDGEKIHNSTGIPVIIITFRNSQGIDNIIKNHFPDSYEARLSLIKKLGTRDTIILKTNKFLLIRTWGIKLDDAEKLLNSFLLQGSIPEPIKLAKIISRAYLNTLY
jgi:endonuclease V-like protein UPF0215 family